MVENKEARMANNVNPETKGLIFPQSLVADVLRAQTSMDAASFNHATQALIGTHDPGIKPFDFALYEVVNNHRSPASAEGVRAGLYVAYRILHTATETPLPKYATAELGAGRFDHQKMLDDHSFQDKIRQTVAQDYAGSPAIGELFTTTWAKSPALRFGSGLLLAIFGRLANPGRPAFRLPPSRQTANLSTSQRRTVRAMTGKPRHKVA